METATVALTHISANLAVDRTKILQTLQNNLTAGIIKKMLKVSFTKLLGVDGIIYYGIIQINNFNKLEAISV